VAELQIGGKAILMAPFWIFVYGLMIFLPTTVFQVTPKCLNHAGAIIPRQLKPVSWLPRRQRYS